MYIQMMRLNYSTVFAAKDVREGLFYIIINLKWKILAVHSKNNFLGSTDILTNFLYPDVYKL